MTSNEIEQAVDNLLAEMGIKYEATHQGTGEYGFDGRKWEHDKWLVIFAKPGYELVEEYRTGSGHRKFDGFKRFLPKASSPNATTVLYSLALDVPLGDETFEDFCSNLGYDTDSRRALESYLKCQEMGSKMRKLFGPRLQELSDLVQEY